MRVLQITHRYAPVRGGSESYFGRLARDLGRSGQAVTVLTTDALDLDHLWGAGFRRIERRRDIIEGAEVLRFPVVHPLRTVYAGLTVKRLSRDAQQIPGLGGAISRRLSRWSPAVPRLYRYLAAREADDTVIHAGNILFDGFVEAALSYARRRGRPFVLTPFPHLGDGSSTVRRDYTSPRQVALIRAAEAVIAQTGFERDWLADSGVDSGRIVLAPDGPDLEELGGGDAERARRRWTICRPFVLYLGPTAVDKGFFDLVDAVSALDAGNVPIGLLAAGPLTAAGRERLERLAPGQAEAVRHLGVVSDTERNDLLAGCLAVALPSRTESLGRTLLEGWFYEKPAIAARAGALPDVVTDGVDGYLVSYGDPAGLAAAIGRLAADPDRRQRLGRAGRVKLLAGYQWAASSRRIRDLFGGLESIR